MVLSAALSGNVWADLKDGLVAYYPFNGNAEDESGNGNDGTVNGATLIEDRLGNKGSAYSFDGNDDYIWIGDKGKPERITISAWFKTTSENGLVIRYRLYGYGITLRGNSIHTYISVDNRNVYTLNTSKGNYQDGIWHHVVLSFDGEQANLYVDRLLITTDKQHDSNSIYYQTGGLSIGRDGDYSSNYFQGDIDDLRIYNRALSESEIQQLYKIEEEEQEKPPKEISSKAIYDIKTKTLSLKGVLVPFLDGFSREETGEKGIFNVQLQEKIKDAFELIPWSINLLAMFEGKDTSGYINYDHEARSVYIPCFKVATIAEIGDGIEGKVIFYKDVTMKQWNQSYPIFHIKDMTKADSCK